jgi:hypothetical protein
MKTRKGRVPILGDECSLFHESLDILLLTYGGSGGMERILMSKRKDQLYPEMEGKVVLDPESESQAQERKA